MVSLTRLDRGLERPDSVVGADFKCSLGVPSIPVNGLVEAVCRSNLRHVCTANEDGRQPGWQAR